MSTAQLTPHAAPRMQPTPWRPSPQPWAGRADQRSLTGLVVAGVASASVASGLIHFAVVPEHWGEYRLAALFFLGLGVFQLAWAALLVARPNRALYLAGAGVSLATIVVWAVSRTTGLPFGPFAHVPEAIGRPDGISTVLEGLVVLGIGLLALTRPGRRRLDRPAYRGWLSAVVGLAGVATLWALLAVRIGHGAMASESLVAALGHHGLHLVFGGGAVVVFGLYVVAHIRRNGWPTFSWRLDA